MDAQDQKTLDDIAQHGWHVVKVMEDEQGPGFAYSVGFFKSYGQPEVIIFGLPLKTLHLIINQIGELIRDGLILRQNLTSDDVLDGSPVRFEQFANRHYRDFLGYANWLYKDSTFPALQCFWPDKDGRYPTDADAPDWLIKAQPALQI